MFLSELFPSRKLNESVDTFFPSETVCFCLDTHTSMCHAHNTSNLGSNYSSGLQHAWRIPSVKRTEQNKYK